jgi:hypothetical protein
MLQLDITLLKFEVSLHEEQQGRVHLKYAIIVEINESMPASETI